MKHVFVAEHFMHLTTKNSAFRARNLQITPKLIVLEGHGVDLNATRFTFEI